MADFGETAGGTRADLLGRAVGPGQFRMFALQCFQLAHHPVVVDVGDLRGVQLMVGAVGLGDLPAEIFGAFGGLELIGIRWFWDGRGFYRARPSGL